MAKTIVLLPTRQKRRKRIAGVLIRLFQMQYWIGFRWSNEAALVFAIAVQA